MTDIVLIKRPGDYLVPATEMDRQLLERIKIGEGITCNFRRKRSLWQHRKFFALMHFAFDCWEPTHEPEYKGLPVVKEFNRFRKDVTIAAEYVDYVPNLRGEIRAQAKSISFDSMDEDEFGALYYRVADVLIAWVLKRYTRDDIDRVVDELVRFAA